MDGPSGENSPTTRLVEIFCLVVLGDLAPQIVIRLGELRSSLRNSYFKLGSRSRNPRHQDCKNQEHKIIEDARLNVGIGFEEIVARQEMRAPRPESQARYRRTKK